TGVIFRRAQGSPNLFFQIIPTGMRGVLGQQSLQSSDGADDFARIHLRFRASQTDLGSVSDIGCGNLGEGSVVSGRRRIPVFRRYRLGGDAELPSDLLPLPSGPTGTQVIGQEGNRNQQPRVESQFGGHGAGSRSSNSHCRVDVISVAIRWRFSCELRTE